MQPRPDVALQLLATEDLGNGTRRLSPPELELEEPIARRGVPLGEEQVVLRLRVDVIDAPGVAQDFDRLLESRNGQRRGGRRRVWTGARGQKQQHGGHRSDEEATDTVCETVSSS
jgi:hypothetical protein